MFHFLESARLFFTCCTSIATDPIYPFCSLGTLMLKLFYTNLLSPLGPYFLTNSISTYINCPVFFLMVSIKIIDFFDLGIWKLRIPGTANVCLQNLRKTLRYGGRKNVPSVEEVTAVSAGRNSKRQMYRLPGGSETVINTKSTTVVDDIISEMCALINVDNPLEMEEFSLYCIVEGDAFTMPLAREEYILDVTTELQKNQQVGIRFLIHWICV